MVKHELLLKISTMLADNTDFESLIKYAEHAEFVEGRFSMTTFTWNCGWMLRIVNIHIPPILNADKQIRYLARLRMHCFGPASGLFVLGGDFNFITEECDHVDLLDGVVHGEINKVGEYWNDHFGNLVEHYQNMPTRADTLSHEHPTASRIDRLYSNHDKFILSGHEHFVKTWGLAVKERYSASDHVSVSSIIGSASVNPLARIPKWIETDPCFPACISDRVRQMTEHTNPFKQLEVVKEAMRVAADDVRVLRQKFVCTHREGHIHFCLMAVRAIDDLSLKNVCLSTSGSAKVYDLFDAHCPGFNGVVISEEVYSEMFASGVLREKLCCLISELSAESSEEEGNTDNLNKLNPSKQSLLHRLWQQKHPRSGVAGILDEAGNPLAGDEGSAKLLEHWARVFEAAQTCPDARRELILAGAPKLGIECWKLSFDEFVQMLKRRRSSAPGPDGISFGCMRAAGDLLFEPLYRAYGLWLEGVELPSDWNLAWLWVLLKGDDPSPDLPGFRVPKDTRPLSGTNCVGKSFSAALLNVSESSGASNKAVTELQEGFISGRVMLRNNCNVETSAYIAANTFEDAAILFLDFIAAFPSLCREWIFAVLLAMDIPMNVVRAIMGLYDNNHHIYRVGKKIYYAFRGDTGVRQGDPLSATIFAWSSHPLLIYMRNHLAPGRYLKGYADDIVVILNSMRAELFDLLRFLMLLRMPLT